MSGKKGLEAQDEIERKLLMEIDAIEDGRERAAREALNAPTRDVVDDMWSTRGGRTRRPMRSHEATKIAAWLGYRIDLTRSVRREDAPALKDAAAWSAKRARLKGASPPGKRRRA